MIAISSYRPFSDSPIIAAHQINAFRSWVPIFERIVYFGKSEPALNSGNTCFVPCDGKPTIKEMAACAGKAGNWACLINADIILDERASKLEAKLNEHNLMCAFSFRIPVGKTEREDLGLDFFCARPEVWRLVEQEIPAVFQLGKIRWDTWIISFFGTHWAQQCADLSPSRLVYHPNHGGRGDQSLTEPPNDRYLRTVSWPKMALTV